MLSNPSQAQDGYRITVPIAKRTNITESRLDREKLLMVVRRATSESTCGHIYDVF